mgnify:CR=1 FL=1|tara:strand:+ start:936 stop:1742 length:807 start_codon:yes stop_codon:yes gene_type:complete
MSLTTETHIRIRPDGVTELVETKVHQISHVSLIEHLTENLQPTNKAFIFPGYKPNTFVVHDLQSDFTHYYEIWDSIGITGNWGLSGTEVKASLTPTWQLNSTTGGNLLGGFPIENEFEFKLPEKGRFLFHVALNPATLETTACLFAVAPGKANENVLFHPLIPNVWASNGTPPGSLCFGEVRAPAMNKYAGFETYCEALFKTWQSGDTNTDLFDEISNTVPCELYEFDAERKAQIPATYSWDWNSQGTEVREKYEWEKEITNARNTSN